VHGRTMSRRHSALSAEGRRIVSSTRSVVGASASGPAAEAAAACIMELGAGICHAQRRWSLAAA
jgi:hypothetical protein